MIMQKRFSRAQDRRGFTLTEVAIVLGIIGLILGAIWVAASAVYNNLRVSRATQELLQVTQAVRSMYATQTLVDTNADMAVGADAGKYVYIQAGVFPTDMLDAGSANSHVAYNPWRGSVSIHSETGPNGGVAGDSFSVTFDEVPQNACISLITSNTGSGRDSAMTDWGAGGAGTKPVGTPVPDTTGVLASTAAGQCTATGSGTSANAVAFYFRLRS